MDLAVKALEMALHDRPWQPGVLIHHSDRGIQHASREYTGMLAEHDIRISMSRRGSPYENARAERCMGTLKEEEVQRRNYQNLDAKRRVGKFLEEIYNRQRLALRVRNLRTEMMRPIEPAKLATSRGKNYASARNAGTPELGRAYRDLNPAR